MKRNLKRKISSIVLVGVLALGLAACSKANAADYSTGMVSYEEIQNEFAQTCKNLTWPEGYEVPKEIDEKKDGSVYQKGFGNTRASMYWEAAWEKEWLNTYKTDPERAEKALRELEKAKKMPYMSEASCDDATREYFAKMLEKAKKGDPTGIEGNIKLNAPE